MLSYYLGYQLADEEVTGNRILGTRIHSALEGYYGYDLDPLAVLGILYQIELDASPEFEHELIAERDLATAMVEGYVEWATAEGIDAGLKVVATEQELILPLPGVEGVQLRAKLDQVVLNEQTGLLSFLDWKTAATFERHEILMLNRQFKFYSMMQKLATQPHDDHHYGPAPEGLPRVDGGILRTLRRVKRTEKAKPPFYAEDQFRYDPETINSMLARTQRAGYEIRKARQALDWVYTEGQGDLELLNVVQRSLFPPTEIETDCSWRCPFVQLCPMLDDGSDWAGALTQSGRYRQENPYAYYDNQNDPLHRVRQVLGQQ